MAVTLRTAAGALQAETPHEMFATSIPGDAGDNPVPYDVTRDGLRFLIEESAGNEASIPLTAVVNWQAELKK